MTESERSNRKYFGEEWFRRREKLKKQCERKGGKLDEKGYCKILLDTQIDHEYRLNNLEKQIQQLREALC